MPPSRIFNSEPTKEELAYIAGLIDGDGSICINRRPYTTVGRGVKGVSFVGSLQLSSQDEAIARWMQKRLGGTVSSWTSSKLYRPQWIWIASSNVAVRAVQLIQPYLRMKKNQAWLLLEYAAQRSHFGGRHTGAPVEELALREGYALAMNELNLGYRRSA